MADKILIIGAGPTGIGAALRLLEMGHQNFLIVEGTSHVGGLASSFVDDKGFTWDVGGHVQFSHYKYFDEWMDKALGPDGWIRHERRSHVWIKNRFVPYPFQNNVHHLDPSDQKLCVEGLEIAATADSQSPKTFRDWILSTFGSGISELFMLPYNMKVWGHPPELLDYRWIGDRVSVVDVNRVKENIRLMKDDVNWGPNNQFRFPKKGGTGEIWRQLANKIPKSKIRLKTRVEKIDLKNCKVKLADGSESYDHLISTMPIDVLCNMIDEKELRKLSPRMVHSSTHIVGVGLSGECPDHLKNRCWMYFPESDCPFYRVTVFSNYSPANVPDPKQFWSLMTETSESRFRHVDTKAIVEQTLEGLKNTQLMASRSQVVSTWHHRVEHGYPVPFLGRDQVLESIHAILEPAHIYSRGRFGGWKYEVSNQDHSFMEGVEVVDRILEGKDEMTYRDPNLVNSRRN